MKKILRICCVATAGMLLAACAAHRDPVEAKIDDLLGRMTLREKIGQMHQISTDADVSRAAAEGLVGSVLNCVDPVLINELQRIAVEETRLGIPLLIGRDVILGF